MNKRGIALIIGFMVIVVLTVLGTAIISSTIIENNLNKRIIGSTKAFWAAEAGVARASAQLPDTTPLSEDDLIGDNNKKLRYNVPSSALVVGFTNRWTVSSTGTYVLAGDSSGNIIDKADRIVTAVVEKPLGPGSGLLTNAIETTGSLNIGNNVDIDPNGSYKSQSSLTFENVFGMSKDSLKAIATRVYVDPSSNQQPVDGITWVDLTGSNKYLISSDWSGSGLLIVNGNGSDVALDIAGQWTFNGVIWVIGKLSISGTPRITGAVFAESGADIVNKLTGNITLTFDGTVRDGAFNLVAQHMGVNILSWKETDNPYPVTP